MCVKVVELNWQCAAVVPIVAVPYSLHSVPDEVQRALSGFKKLVQLSQISVLAAPSLPVKDVFQITGTSPLRQGERTLRVLRG